LLLKSRSLRDLLGGDKGVMTNKHMRHIMFHALQERSQDWLLDLGHAYGLD